jgi:hypothetical protein
VRVATFALLTFTTLLGSPSCGVVIAKFSGHAASLLSSPTVFGDAPMSASSSTRIVSGKPPRAIWSAAMFLALYRMRTPSCPVPSAHGRNSLQLLNAVCETESWARCGGSLVLLRSSCVGMATFSYVARGARLLRQMRCAHPSSAGYCHSPTSTVGRTVTENCIHRARHRSPRIAALAPSLPFSAPGLGVIESHNGRIWVTRGRLDSRCANSSPGPGWSIGEFRFRNAEVRIRPSSANTSPTRHI